jgi:hypothetical protein
MSNELRRVIENFESNRQILTKTLNDAGGDAERILSLPSWQDVQFTLAANNISINATYLKKKN